MDTKLLDKIDMTTLSPMMRQYVELKRNHMDCLLLFRLGDFYELFFDDALIASKILELALTGRNCSQAERAPMCGIPHHAIDNYLTKLIEAGYKVAICEQVEDNTNAKELVKREIIKIVTPGTVTESGALDAGKNNYLLSVYQLQNYYGLAFIDISTYDLQVTIFNSGNTKDLLKDEIKRLASPEIVCNQAFYNSELATTLAKDGILISEIPEEGFSTREYIGYWAENSPNKDLSGRAINALLWYLASTQNRLSPALQPAKFYQREHFLYLDAVARRNLEICESLSGGGKKGSLLGLLDCTETAMGSRMLRKLIEQPLMDLAKINARLDAVEELKKSFMVRQELRESLQGMQDMERLTTKILNGSATPRDLGNLCTTLSRLPQFITICRRLNSELLTELASKINNFEELYAVLAKALVERPPLQAKEGGIIAPGYNSECDELKEATVSGRQWIIELEQSEREKTGIRNLKVGYNRVFGYYFEVSRSHIASVPEYFIRKQTLTNGERYFTDELKKLENKVLGAQQKLLQLEYMLFNELRTLTSDYGSDLLISAANLAYIDSLLALAENAERNNYSRPILNNDNSLNIIAGRHPIVEHFLEAGKFVPNDLVLADNKSLVLLTGPNMAGKSTFMRQIAHIVILAQMGSFVPATKAILGITDAVYTRIGASDDLASGQSTFMVEMQEVATILQKSSPRSLLIMDEIGRGTSTYDGLAIASAVIEKLANPKGIGARTLFSTHYHELVELEDTLPALINYHVDVKREKDTIIFLHQIKRGGSDDSFGIEVAKLAGVPTSVVNRANQILKLLEKNNSAKKKLNFHHSQPLDGQLELFEQNFNSQPNQQQADFLKKIADLDIQQLSPLDAFHILNDFIKEAKNLDQ